MHSSSDLGGQSNSLYTDSLLVVDMHPKDKDLDMTLSAETDRVPGLDKAVATLPKSSYEARQVTGKSVGVFALKKIVARTRVLCEKPLLVLPEDAGTLELYRAINTLGDNGISQFWALSASAEPCADDDWIEELQATYRSM